MVRTANIFIRNFLLGFLFFSGSARSKEASRTNAQKAANTFSKNMIGLVGCHDFSEFVPMYLPLLQDAVKGGLQYGQFKAILFDYADDRTAGKYNNTYEFLNSRILGIADQIFQNPNHDFTNDKAFAQKLVAIQEEAKSRRFRCRHTAEVRKAIPVESPPQVIEAKHAASQELPVEQQAKVDPVENPNLLTGSLQEAEPKVEMREPAPLDTVHQVEPKVEMREPAPIQIPVPKPTTPDPTPAQAPVHAPAPAVIEVPSTSPRYNVDPKRLAQLKQNAALRAAIEEDDDIGAHQAIKAGAQAFDPESAMQPLALAITYRRSELVPQLLKMGAPTEGRLMQVIRQLNAGFRGYEVRAQNAFRRQLMGIMHDLMAHGATLSPDEIKNNSKDIYRFIEENKDFLASPSLIGAHLIESGFDTHYWFPPLKSSRVLNGKLKELKKDPWGTLNQEQDPKLHSIMAELQPRIDLKNYSYSLDKNNVFALNNCEDKYIHLTFKADGVVETLSLKAKDRAMCDNWIGQISAAKNSAEKETKILLKDGLAFTIVNNDVAPEGPLAPKPAAPAASH